MKVLERYVVRELLIPIACAAAALIFLILIADLFDNLDDILRAKTPLRVVAKYYLALTPAAFTQTIAWSVWLGTLFLLVNLNFHNEIIAMKAAGLKITAIVKPLLFTGFLTGILTFVVGDRLAPASARLAGELHEVYIQKKKDESSRKIFQNVTYHSSEDEIYYFRTFSPAEKEVRGAIVLWLNDKAGQTHRKMVASRGKWTGAAWEFYSVTEFQTDSRGSVLGEPRTHPKKNYPEINFPPEELVAASSESAFLSYRGLKRAVQKLKENGVRVESEIVDLHQRLAAPWQGLVMMLVTIPFLARTANRRSVAVHVLFCVAVIFIYHVAGAVGLAMGKAGKLIPFLSAWAGNILCALGALFNLEKANY